MAQYYIQLNRYTRNPDQLLFVGPFDKRQDAEMQVDIANSNNQEVVLDEGKPSDPNSAIHAEIVGKTIAVKLGMVEDKLLKEIPSIDQWDELVPEQTEEAGSEQARGRGRPKGSTSTKAAIPTAAVPTRMPAKQPLKSKVKAPVLDGSHRVIIVTRYPSTAQWLYNNGIRGEVVDRVRNPSQIKDAIVIGILPYRLAAETYLIGSVDMPGLRADQRGTPLTPEDMDDAGAELRWYSIKEVDV